MVFSSVAFSPDGQTLASAQLRTAPSACGMLQAGTDTIRTLTSWSNWYNFSVL